MKSKLKIVFVVYNIFIIYFVLFKFNFTLDSIKESINTFRINDYQKVNFILFKSILMQLKLFNFWSVINLFANTIPFILYGVLFRLSVVKYNYIFIVLNVLFVLLIEFIQLFFVIGTFDIDDIFLNILCIYIGVFISSKLIFNRH